MTAFARQEASFEWGTLTWEIKSVNHRYLEPHFRVPETLRQIEQNLREKLRKYLSRGKIEASCHLQFAQAEQQAPAINQALLAQLGTAIEQVQAHLPKGAKVNALDVLKWPGILQQQEVDHEALQAKALEQFSLALEQLNDNRDREGAELQKFIEQRLDAIAEQVKAVRALMPGILSAQKAKLQSKLEELQADLDAERLEQEIVLVAQKADVDEELDRLDTHLLEVRRTLTQKGAVGRRLDFLMQELNREANTLSSKSIVSETTQAAVELKVLIEQMREQIQNIE
jgi:uncharacterized protein (TIGR00255 family)